MKNPSDLDVGANCQLFASELLRYFGYTIPDFRSSDLWKDETCTMNVSEFQSFDLMLYHHKPKS